MSGMVKKQDYGCDMVDNSYQPVSGKVPIKNEVKNRPK